MGFRTVVMFSNDYANEWQNDPELGKKIAIAMNYAGRSDNRADYARLGNYGEVVQCVHADTQSLVVLDGYTFCTDLASKQWHGHQEQEAISLELLKRAAEKMGYRLSKKPVSK